MADIVQVTGFILSSMPVGEYDRRIVILSKELGKISKALEDQTVILSVLQDHLYSEPLNVTVAGILILYSKQRLRITLRNS